MHEPSPIAVRVRDVAGDGDTGVQEEGEGMNLLDIRLVCVCRGKGTCMACRLRPTPEEERFRSEVMERYCAALSGSVDEQFTRGKKEKA